MGGGKGSTAIAFETVIDLELRVEVGSTAGGLRMGVHDWGCTDHEKASI